MKNIGVNIYEEGHFKYLETFQWIIYEQNTQKLNF